jgi:hypothetical protein
MSGSCEHGDEPYGSGTMELVVYVLRGFTFIGLTRTKSNVSFFSLTGMYRASSYVGPKDVSERNAGVLVWVNATCV